MILGPLDTIVGHLAKNLLSGGPIYRISKDFGSFLDPVGVPFFILGVTILIPGSGMVRFVYFVGNLISG